jgi:hypothetical protein
MTAPLEAHTINLAGELAGAGVTARLPGEATGQVWDVAGQPVTEPNGDHDHLDPAEPR